MDDADYAALAFSWSDLSADEKEAALGQVVNDLLDDFGYDPVEVESAELGGNLGEYGDGTVTFDSEGTLGDDVPFDQALETAFHEAGHAMNDQADEAIFGDDDDDDYNAIDPDADNGSLLTDPEHREVEDFARGMVDEVRAGVERVSPSTSAGASGSGSADGGGESGSSSSAPAEDFSFEIDFANATVTDESFFEIDEAGVVVSP